MPVNSFSYKDNVVNFVNNSIDEGIAPVSRLEDRSKYSNNDPIVDGIPPINLLKDKEKLTNFDNDPMDDGIVPVN